MLFPLPDPETLYAALIARDPVYDGRVYVGVSTTGVFCRLTCAARKPRRENCTFYETVAECFDAGLRPCMRCRPVATEAAGDPVVQTLLDALGQDPSRVWTEESVARLGYDPSTVRRSFKRHFGMTFLDMARQLRLRSAMTTLSGGGRVIEAQLDAGYDSPSGFRAAFARWLGCAPSEMAPGEGLVADWIDTPLGPMIAVCDARTLHLLEFTDRKALPSELRTLRAAVRGRLGIGRTTATDRTERELRDYFAGELEDFTIPLTLEGSAFARSVWQCLRGIPAGETRSYRDIAKAVGRPDAVRAVARANGANRIAVIVPCHRVIGSDGSLTGYGGGLWRKQRLIEIERTLAERRGEKV